MTSEQLRPLLDNPHDMKRFWRMGQELVRAETLYVVVDAIRLGRITALSKFSGGVRGIVSGDTNHRLVARTVAHPEVEKATAPCRTCHPSHDRYRFSCAPERVSFLHSRLRGTSPVSVYMQGRVNCVIEQGRSLQGANISPSKHVWPIPPLLCEGR